MLNNIKRRSSDKTGWLVLFSIVLLDSLINYFVNNLTGRLIAINALLPLWLLILVLRGGVKPAIPPLSSLTWVSLAVLGFMIWVIYTNSLYLIPEIATALIAFTIGVGTGRWIRNETVLAKVFLIIGGTYAVVCVIAVLQLFPSAFPIVKDIGNYHGTMTVRPSVTTDQNFQIFYIFIPSLVLSLRFKIISSGLAIFFTVCTFYVLAKLQTRSGMILITNIVFLSLLAPIIYPNLGRKKVFILPIAAFILIVINMDHILEAGQEFIQRNSQENRLETFHGRIYSAQYMFKNLANPSFWLPHGEGDFIKKTGHAPHFTPTAFYLQGGIFALAAWVGIFMIPLISLGRMFLQGKLDEAAIMIFIGAVTSFIAQLSLNAPHYEHIWLWAGAAIGTLERLKVRSFYRTRSKHTISRKQHA